MDFDEIQKGGGRRPKVSQSVLSLFVSDEALGGPCCRGLRSSLQLLAQKLLP